MTSPPPPMLAIVAAIFRFRVVGILEPLKKKNPECDWFILGRGNWDNPMDNSKLRLPGSKLQW